MYRFVALVSVAACCVRRPGRAQKSAPRPSTKYDLSAASNQEFLADYAARARRVQDQGRTAIPRPAKLAMASRRNMPMTTWSRSCTRAD